MSDTLTAAAPAQSEAVAPVGEPAPTPSSEVDGGSGDGTIPVARFNGLMSSFNKAQAEKADLERQITELRSALETKPTQEKPTPVSDDTSAQIRELRDMLMEERLKSARREVLDEYPDAKPFADLIVADTQEDLREMAKLISDRLKGVTAPAATTEVTTETEAPAEQVTAPVAAAAPVVEAPVTAAGVAVEGQPNVEDRVVDAIKKRSFGDYLAAKWESMGPDQLEEAAV